MLKPSSKHTNKLKKQILIVVFGFGLATPIYAVEVINNVKTSASTGGNTAGAGEVIQGESEVQVKIYTEVDGNVVTDIDEEVVRTEAEIEKKVEVSLPDVESTIEVDSAISVEQDEGNPITAFFSKLFKYVFSIFRT